jgi:hypothetical protein
MWSFDAPRTRTCPLQHALYLLVHCYALNVIEPWWHDVSRSSSCSIDFFIEWIAKSFSIVWVPISKTCPLQHALYLLVHCCALNVIESWWQDVSRSSRCSTVILYRVICRSVHHCLSSHSQRTCPLRKKNTHDPSTDSNHDGMMFRPSCRSIFILYRVTCEVFQHSLSSCHGLGLGPS